MKNIYLLKLYWEPAFKNDYTEIEVYSTVAFSSMKNAAKWGEKLYRRYKELRGYRIEKLPIYKPFTI